MAKRKPAGTQSSSPPKRAIIARQSQVKGTQVTEAQLIQGLNDDLKAAWKKLRAFAQSLGDQRIYPAIQSIMFARKFCYFYVRPKKTSLEVWIFLPHAIDGLKFTATSGQKVRYCNLYKVTHSDQIEEPLTDWLREAYEFAPALE